MKELNYDKGINKHYVFFERKGENLIIYDRNI